MMHRLRDPFTYLFWGAALVAWSTAPFLLGLILVAGLVGGTCMFIVETVEHYLKGD